MVAYLGNQRFRSFACFLAATFISLSSSLAFAATHDVCGSIYYYHDLARWSSSAGSLETVSSPRNLLFKQRVRLQLWDKNGDCEDKVPWCFENDDLLLGSTYTDTSGSYCFNDINGVYDIYLATDYSTPNGEVLNDSGQRSWRASGAWEDFGIGQSSPTIYRHWNITCWLEPYNSIADFWCDDIDATGFFSTEKTYSNLARVIQRSHDVLGAWQPNGAPAKISAYYPDSPAGDCSDPNGPGNLSISDDEFCTSSARNNHIWAHEIGHCLHKRAMGTTNSLTDGTCSDTRTWSSLENEKCATAEGWADFVSGAAHFEKNAADPEYNTSNLELGGCVSPSSWSYRRTGNVSRYFWDLYDSTNGSSGESSTDDPAFFTFPELMNKWDLFPNGYFNHQKNEIGDHGRNVKDFYHWHEYYWPSTASWVWNPIVQNCLTQQTNG